MIYIGACLILLASTWIGFDKSKQYIIRVKNIKQMIACLQIMEAEMLYNKQSLQQIFQLLASKSKDPFQHFFSYLSEQLAHTVADIQDLWQKESDNLRKKSKFHEEEIEVWSQFGRSIGDYHAKNQQQQIQITQEYLQQILRMAIEERQIYSKLYQSAGFLVGLFVVILFL